MTQEIHGDEDNYYKVDTDILFLVDRVIIVKNKIRDTSWCHIGTKIELRKELKDLEKEHAKIIERLHRLHVRNEYAVEMVRRP